jgi:hypothetical protein
MDRKRRRARRALAIARLPESTLWRVSSSSSPLPSGTSSTVVSNDTHVPTTMNSAKSIRLNSDATMRYVGMLSFHPIGSPSSKRNDSSSLPTARRLRLIACHDNDKRHNHPQHQQRDWRKQGASIF